MPVRLERREASDLVIGIVVSLQHAEQLCGIHGRERPMNPLEGITYSIKG